jgi:hypothetical protein
MALNSFYVLRKVVVVVKVVQALSICPDAPKIREHTGKESRPGKGGVDRRMLDAQARQPRSADVDPGIGLRWSRDGGSIKRYCQPGNAWAMPSKRMQTSKRRTWVEVETMAGEF